MTDSLDLGATRMVALSRDALTALRAALVRDGGPAAVSYLQEAGFAGGEPLYQGFRRWLADRGLGEPESLGLEPFRSQATAYFQAAGWGALSFEPQDDLVLLSSGDWGESDPASGLDFPGCHVTAGMFGDFFGRLADAPLAVLEVECRSSGSERCTFVLGSPDVLTEIYEGRRTL